VGIGGRQQQCEQSCACDQRPSPAGDTSLADEGPAQAKPGQQRRAYFTQKKAVKGSPKFQTSYQGGTYYFSSAADLATFKKSPAKYVPQYGGFCANGVANRKANESDPTVFFVLKGKLYVCASSEAEKEFQSNPANVKKADDNWEDQYEWFY
jgi:YHS domain-containing protein